MARIIKLISSDSQIEDLNLANMLESDMKQLYEIVDNRNCQLIARSCVMYGILQADVVANLLQEID